MNCMFTIYFAVSVLIFVAMSVQQETKANIQERSLPHIEKQTKYYETWLATFIPNSENKYTPDVDITPLLTFSIENNRYYTINQNFRLFEAETFCKHYSMHLVNIDSEIENLLVHDRLKELGFASPDDSYLGYSFWTSGYKLEDENLVWLNGSSPHYMNPIVTAKFMKEGLSGLEGQCVILIQQESMLSMSMADCHSLNYMRPLCKSNYIIP